MKIASLLCWLGVVAALAAAPAAGQPVSRERATFETAIDEAKSAMMADPQQALKLSDEALARAAALPRQELPLARATALWLKIEAHIGLNQLQQAEPLLAEALTLVERHGANSKLHGDLLRARGAVAGLQGHMQAALRDYLAAHRIFQLAGETRSQAIALQDVGQIYWEAGDYARMLRYYGQAKELYDDDPAFSLTTHNNTGEALRALGRGAQAELEYRAALEDARTLGSPLLETRILSNLALVQADLGKLDAATANAQRALRIGAQPEAAEWQPFVYGVLARIAAERGQHRQAARLLEKALAGVRFDRTDLAFKEFHELGAALYERLDQPEMALAHLKAFQRLDGEARDLTSTASSQLMAAQFDFANQNLRIAERDVEIQRQRVRFRTTLFAGLTVAATILLAMMTAAYLSIRRSRNEVRATNSVLTQVNTKLEKALRAKTDFLAMTSHEIRTPLNGILGMTQVMLASRALDSGTREQVQLVHGAGETMRALVDDILDVSKMETGEVTVDLGPTPLRSILEDAVALWRAKAAAKGLTLEADLDVPALIESDASKLRQIVFNLLSNAIKFTVEGSVHLSANRQDGADELAIVVRDSGVGIAESQQAEIFEAFHQVDNAMTRQFSGTGLGLAICRNLVQALGGSISVASEVDKGSVFTVTLPLREIEHAAHMLGLEQTRIGFVEADENKRAVISKLLSPHVAAVVGVASAAAAHELLSTERIDQLVIDSASVTRGADGLAQLGALLIRARENGVATIVLLALQSEIGAEALADFRPDRILPKPVRGAELTQTVRRLARRTEPISRKLVA